MATKIKLISQYVKDLSFENYAAQRSEFPKEEPIVHIDIKIKRKVLKNGLLEVTLLLLLEAKNKTEKLFLIELSYAATFNVGSLKDPSEDKRVIFVDCPNIMFPFVRQILFTITLTSGFSPLTLDHIDFHELFDSQTVN